MADLPEICEKRYVKLYLKGNTQAEETLMDHWPNFWSMKEKSLPELFSPPFVRERTEPNARFSNIG